VSAADRESVLLSKASKRFDEPLPLYSEVLDRLEAAIEGGRGLEAEVVMLRLRLGAYVDDPPATLTAIRGGRDA